MEAELGGVVATYELIIDNARMDVHCHDISGPNPILFSLGDDEDPAWHQADDINLVEWDNDKAVVIWSDSVMAEGDDETDPDGVGLIAMIHRLGAGLRVGNIGVVYEPSDGYNQTNGYANDSIKMGDYVVHWRTDTGRLYTFSYNEAADTFTELYSEIVPFPDTAYSLHGGRLVPWGDDSILFVCNNGSFAPSGVAVFGKWTGSDWSFGSVYNHTLPFGSDNQYLDGNRIVDKSDTGTKYALTCDIDYPDNYSKYLLISGDYPDAPTITDLDLLLDYQFGTSYKQMFPASVDGNVINVYDSEPGTTTPKTTPRPFDWCVRILSLDDGVLTVGDPVNIGVGSAGTDDRNWDIYCCQTPDGSIWATNSIDVGTGLAVRKIGDPPVNVATDTDDGPEGANWYRQLVPMGNDVLSTWHTQGNYQGWALLVR